MGRDPTGMAPAFVFGYGSLLDGATGTPCRLRGWRRRVGVSADLDLELGGPVWAYAGLPEARERYAAAAAAGRAVVARAYVDHVRAGLAAHGLVLDAAL